MSAEWAEGNFDGKDNVDAEAVYSLHLNFPGNGTDKGEG